MDDKKEDLNHRQLSSQEEVEKNGEYGDSYHDECAMPLLEDVFRVIENNQPLNLRRGVVGRSSAAGLPAQHAAPADEVAEMFLEFPRSKLGDPVILSARRWSPGVAWISARDLTLGP